MRLDSLFPTRRPLLESKADYEAMVRDLRMAIDAYVARKMMPATDVNDMVERARSLGRADRAIWYLRFARLTLASFIDDFDPITLADGRTFDPKAYYEALIREFLAAAAKDRQRTGNDNPSTESELRMTAGDLHGRNMDNLRHFLSLPVPAIQNYVFAYQHPLHILGHFSNLEAEWQEKRRGLVFPLPGDEPLITFNGTRAWWLLDRKVCSAEGEAMGHCGNAGNPRSGDRLLSLRDRHGMMDGKPFYKPYLTFVLDSDGRLGEMKARFNKNPKQAAAEGVIPSEFQDEIAALLMHRMVTGIKGGGYEADKNFKMDDLAPELRDKLYAEKRSLMSLAEQVSRGIADTNDMISQYRYIFHGFEGVTGIAWLPDRKLFRVARYPSVMDMLQDLIRVRRQRQRFGPTAIRTCNYLLNPSTYPVDTGLSHSGSGADPAVVDLLEDMEQRVPDAHTALVQYLWDEYPDEMGDKFSPASNNEDYAYHVSSSKLLFRIASNAIEEGIRAGRLKLLRAAFEDYLKAFELDGDSLCRSAELEDTNEIKLEAPISIVVTPEDMAEALEMYSSEDAEIQSLAPLIGIQDMFDPEVGMEFSPDRDAAVDAFVVALRDRLKLG